ncbi:MAG: amidohydrolase [Acidimicrobiia bacterium]|nr:amidohydrolase [Acidimicrobiia bacterium]
MLPDDHYTIITADSHAGGSHADYREYLEEKYVADFDEWRGEYKNPWKDLKDDRRTRNWDSEVRWEQQEADGVVGEVIFPNTVPPFFPGFVLFAGPPRPEDYEHRLAGVRAHNRWLVDFCAEAPERRAGVGQIFINDVDDAIADATWIKEHGLRGGVLLPNVAPDATWVDPLYSYSYDPLWAALVDLDIPINIHGGTGAPDYGKHPSAMIMYISEVGFYSQRPLVHMIMSGVFERFPGLRVVLTETAASWLRSLFEQLDGTMSRITRTGATGEIRYRPEAMLPQLPSDYFHQNFWMGVSQPRPTDAAALDFIGVDRFMWGSDYPHDEGTYPFTREHLRQVFLDRTTDEKAAILGGNAAAFYDFDLEALQPLADRIGPTVAELEQPLLELPAEPNDVLLAGAAG